MKSRFLLFVLYLWSFSSFFGQKNYLDNSFGNNGIVTTNYFIPNAICIQKDGKILVGGEISRPFNSSTNSKDYILYRFNVDGSIDNDFGTSGKVDEYLLGQQSIVGICENADHKIILLRADDISIMSYNTYVTFMRLNLDGTKDQTFGTNGIKKLSFGGSGLPMKMVQLQDGKIIVIGSNKPIEQLAGIHTYPNPVIAKLNANITFDTSFNQTGYRKFNSFMNTGFRFIDVMKDGTAVAGFRYQNDIVLHKLLYNGQMDDSFGNNGVKKLDFGSATDNVQDVKILPENKIFLSGSVDDIEKRAVLARLLKNGTPDITFGINGYNFISNKSGKFEVVVQSLLLNDGKTISALQKYKNGYDFSLLITDHNEDTDLSSSDQSLIITSMDNDQRILCIAQQPDGKILAAGFDSERMILMRYDISDILDVKTAKKSKIKIFPNPANNFIIIQGIGKQSPYSIYSSSAQKVSEGVSTGSDINIDISGFASGNYFLRTAEQTFAFIKL